MDLDRSAAGAHVRVLFFGRVGDLFGREMGLRIPELGCALSALRARVALERADGSAALAEARAAVGREIVHGDAWVSPGQEVAFFSMFSGG